jgi:serine/threonine-protein kinase
MEPTRIGRYRVYEAIGSGGMASVHFGTFAGPAGFARTVAIKRMHPHLAKNPEFVAMFVDEARVASRIGHPNAVATLDVLASGDELLIVMDYVHGEPLTRLVGSKSGRSARISRPIACAIATDVLSGLHAAHEATDDRGQPLAIVHRDVSPHNILVGADGCARVFDFGVAKAIGRLQVTREGQVKGKIAYMAPEQVRGGAVDRLADVYSVAVVLWEMLTGRRLFDGERDADIVEKILFGMVDAPAAVAPEVPEQLNAIVLKGLARNPADRFGTARDMARSLRDAVRIASASEVADWVESIAGETLTMRRKVLARIESAPEDSPRPTQIAVPAPSHAAAPRRGLRAGMLVAIIAALGALGLVAARSIEAPGEHHQPSSAHQLEVDPTARLAVSPLQTASAPGVVSPPSATVSSPPPAASVVKGAAQGQPPVKRTTRPSQAQPTECDPPYTTDADGTRRYKLKCL